MFSKKEENYDSDTKNKTDLDQTDDKYLLKLRETIKKKLHITKMVYSFMYNLFIYDTMRAILWNVTIIIMEQFLYKLIDVMLLS